MRVGYVSPSGNYNIVLSKEELNQLVDKSSVTFNPVKIKSRFIENGKNEEVLHSLEFITKDTSYPVQFLSIIVDDA